MTHINTVLCVKKTEQTTGDAIVLIKRMLKAKFTSNGIAFMDSGKS